MNMTSVVDILTGFFEAIIILMFIHTYACKKSDEMPAYKYALSALTLAVLINVINRYANFTILNVLLFGLSIFVVSFTCNRRFKMDIMLSIIALLILSISEIVVLFSITNLANITVEEATLVENYRILGVILSKFLAFAILKLLCIKHKDNNRLTIKTSYWVLFVVIFITSTLTIFLLFIFQYSSKTISIYNKLSVWCSFGLLYSTFFSLYLYENLAKQAEAERKQEIFKQQILSQSKHLNEILITQKQIKKLRHDMVNHNISIQGFFENKDYKGGLEYIKNINSLINLPDNIVETGNAALDAIINTKKSIALSKGIAFLTNIQIPENLFVDAIDICIIFGNALDNCIEACDKIKNGSKKISVSIVYDDNSIICKIVNTTQKSSINILHTSKKDKDNHGFGIENIKSALAKYKNVCNFVHENDEFTLSFVIFKK